MKVAVSLPDALFESAEALGRRLGLSRSRLYSTALQEFVAKHQGRKVTDRLNAVYSTEASGLDADVLEIQRRSVRRNTW